MEWKTQDDRWAWLSVPPACCTRLLCERSPSRSPAAAACPAASEHLWVNRIHTANEKGMGSFSLMEGDEQHPLGLDSSCHFYGAQDEGFLLLSTESSKCSN